MCMYFYFKYYIACKACLHNPGSRTATVYGQESKITINSTAAVAMTMDSIKSFIR